MRLAVIGTGDVAYRDYLPEAHRLAPLGRVTLAVARRPGRAEAAAAAFGIPRWTTDWAEAMGPEIDAVLNLTPAPAHGPINLALVRAGKHLYSEKPLAASVAEADAIIAAAAQTGAVIAAAPSVMVYPQLRAAARLIAEGAIGPIRSLRATATTPPPPWTGYTGDHAPFFAADVGPLSDMGVYPLHAILGLAGRAVTVTALSRRTRSAFDVTEGPFAGTTVPVEVDDNHQLLLALESGALASLQCANCIIQPASCELEIAGETGALALSLLAPAAPLRHYQRGAMREIAVAPGRTAGPDHILGVEELLLAVRDRRPPAIGAEAARHVIAIRAAAALSAQSGRHVDLDPRI
jgi:predicted dehydrogenase